MKSLFVITAVLFLSAFNTNAQDTYFSNFDKARSMNNPSAIGFSNDMTFNTLYRLQWLGAVTPNAAGFFEFTYPLKQRFTNKKLMTFGMSFLNDRFGDGGFFTSTQVSGSAFYHLDIAEGHHTSLGVKLGYVNSGTNTANLTSGSQWNGVGFDQSLGLGESFTNTVYHQLEVTPSFSWFMTEDGNLRYHAGVSLFNVNHSMETNREYQNILEETFRRPMRMSVSAGANFYLNQIRIAPSGMYYMQGNNHLGMIGTDVFYGFPPDADKRHEIGLGLYYRLIEAPVVRLQYSGPSFNTGIAYDIPVGTPASLGSNGSIEFFFNVPIGVKRKTQKFTYVMNVYDENTKQPLESSVSARSTITKEKKDLFEGTSGEVELEVRNEYEIMVKKEGYKTKKINLKQTEAQGVSEDVFLMPLHTKFELELIVKDKDTDEDLAAMVYYLTDGEKELISEEGKVNGEYLVDDKHQFIIELEDYHQESAVIRFRRYGMLSKTIYLRKIKPEIPVSKFNMIVVNADTKERIGATVMATDITDPNDKTNSVLALNQEVPADFPMIKNRTFELLITKEGYFNTTATINTSGDETTLEIELVPIAVGKKMVIENLQFKTGSAEVDLEKSERALNLLEDFMKSNPNVRVEISGHTDSDGSNSFNQKLSEDRAASARQVILDRGIPEDRIVSVGKGEMEPVAPNDSDENKALNRRVELKIIE